MSAATERNGHIEWKEVSADHPCAICGKPKWCRRDDAGTRFSSLASRLAA